MIYFYLLIQILVQLWIGIQLDLNLSLRQGCIICKLEARSEEGEEGEVFEVFEVVRCACSRRTRWRRYQIKVRVLREVGE